MYNYIISNFLLFSASLPLGGNFESFVQGDPVNWRSPPWRTKIWMTPASVVFVLLVRLFTVLLRPLIRQMYNMRMFCVPPKSARLAVSLGQTKSFLLSRMLPGTCRLKRRTRFDYVRTIVGHWCLCRFQGFLHNVDHYKWSRKKKPSVKCRVRLWPIKPAE